MKKFLACALAALMLTGAAPVLRARTSGYAAGGAGEDVSFRSAEETTSSAEETTTAPDTEETTAPQASEETTTAQAVEETTTSSPAEETTAGAPAEETTAGGTEETTSAPVEETTAAPVEETTAPPVEETTVPPVEETTAHVHEFSDWTVVTPATCVDPGLRERVCSGCGETEREELPVDPDAHVGATELRGEEEATLTRAGYTGDLVCTACGGTVEKGSEVFAAHLLGDVDGVEGVSVTDARIILREAVGLGSIDALYAPFGDLDLDLAMTVNDARSALRCAVALDEPTQVNYLVVSREGATCTEKGSASYTDGEKEMSMELVKRPHLFRTVSSVSATCLGPGSIKDVCSECGAEKITETKPLGHKPTAADCVNPSVCSVCAAVLAPALGHRPLPADCVNPSVCSVCAAVLSPALGHDMLPATCLAPSKCSRCGITVGKPSGHVFAAATYAAPKTCLVCGYTEGDPLGVTVSSNGYKIRTTEDGFTYVDGLLIVNKTYSLPSDYDPGGLTAECAAAFRKMQAGASRDGISLWELSGYRSYWTQYSLYNRYVSRDGRAAADRYSARPGHSEHQTGLAIDVNSVSSSFRYTKEGIWLAKHCAEYGFIIRYPAGKEDKTGYMYEPWHVRYVGSAELARKITASGLCLEEYYGLTSRYA